MSRKEVAITGMGLITSLGGTLPETWENVKAGSTGIVQSNGKDLPNFLTCKAPAPEAGPPEDIPRKLRV